MTGIADTQAPLEAVLKDEILRMYQAVASRGDPARPRAEGSGLGLSIAKAGGDAHGGLLELVRASPGAAFRLTLPATGAGRS